MRAEPAPDPTAGTGVDDANDPRDPDHLAEDDRPRFVRFALDDRSFLVPVGDVQEVLVAGPCTRLPGSPEAVLGVVNVRGRIVAVVDPRSALHPAADAPTDSAGRFLVVATPRGPVGLHVDRVADVVSGEPAAHDVPGAPAAVAAEASRSPVGGPDPAVITGTVTVVDAALEVVDAVALVAAALGTIDAAEVP